MARVHNIEVSGAGTPVHRARLAVQVIASDTGTVPALVSTSEGAVSASATVETNVDGLWSADLVPNEPGSHPHIVAPADSYYRIDFGRVRYSVSVPNPPDPTTTTAPVTLPAASVPVASTAGFLAGPGRSVYINGQVVSYSSVTATSFEGCSGGTGLVPAGTAVEQSYWAGDILTEPVVGLPDLHQSVPVGAHAASAVAVSPAVAGASQVQAALEGLETALDGVEAELDAAVALRVAKAGDTMTGPLLLPDGSVTAPALAFSAGTGTGVWRPAANVLAFATGGVLAGRVERDGSTFFGRGAGAVDTSLTCTGFGRDALLGNTTGANNSAFGLQALFSNTTGADNSAFGLQALFSNTTGAGNSAFGRRALISNTTGASNSAFGLQALFSNTTGANNSAFGLQALFSNTTGAGNSAFGRQALFSNTTGADNCALGFSALRDNTTGANNSAFGRFALYAPGGVTANATTTGLRQTAIGSGSGQGSATQRNDITVVGFGALADGDHATALGSGANAGAAGAVAIGRDSAGTPASTTTANQIRLGTALHTVAVPGLIRWLTAGNEQTTVGAAGGASALPATPAKYLKVIDSAGTTLVVPAYAAA